jgi:NTP pyrophosphatase (non-canonical NTP hydrolase)
VSELHELRDELRRFAADREWERFHDPKNLSMAVASEAGELLAEFRWLSPGEASPEHISEETKRAASLEMADVLIFLVRLADVLDVDLAAVAREKIIINEDRFPPRSGAGQ